MIHVEPIGTVANTRRELGDDLRGALISWATELMQQYWFENT